MVITHSKKTVFGLYCSLVVFLVANAACAMTPLDDEALAQKTGQNNTLLTVATTGVGENGNPNKDVAFTKIGFQGKLELNANIRKLQLGCGGVNGVGKCDIDVDYARFVGLSALNADGTPKPDGGPASAFELINPFFELAIQNPDSLTDRRFVGMRVGGEKSRGVLSAGTRPVNADGTARLIKVPGTKIDDPSFHAGLNSLSAYAKRVVANDVTVPAVATVFGGDFIPLEATIKADESPNPNNEARTNVFTDVYTSRASQLRLALLDARALPIPGILPNGIKLNVDLLSDTRFIHNIKIGGGTENDPKYSDSFFISLSGLGDNNVWITNSGDKSISRQTGGDGTTVVNQLSPNPVEDRLHWQVDNKGNTNDWKEALRGWSFFLPEIRIENAKSAKFRVDVIDAVRGIVGQPVAADQIDLKQVPVDNCYGGLTFC